MIEDPQKLETAEEKATRMWRNNQIIKKTRAADHRPIPKVDSSSLQIQKPINIRRALIEVFTQRRDNIIMNYKLSIQSQKRKLMLEKIRRMEQPDGQS